MLFSYENFSSHFEHIAGQPKLKIIQIELTFDSFQVKFNIVREKKSYDMKLHRYVW